MDQSKFPRLFFGEYTATLKFKHTVNGERITTEKEISFWVIPWKLMLLLVAIIVGIIILIRKIRKKRKEKYTASARRFK
jgi:ABC-type multidrug transport system permease subunit